MLDILNLNTLSHMALKYPVFFRIPDQDFHYFYTCEIILSHIPVPARGKDEKTNSSVSTARLPHVDPLCHCNVKMTSSCRISANSGFSGSLFHVFQIKNTCSVVSKKNNPLFV